MKLNEAKEKLGYKHITVYLGSCFMDKNREDYDTDEEYENARQLAEEDIWVQLRMPKVDEAQDMAGNRFIMPDGLNLENPNVMNAVFDRIEKKGKEESTSAILQRSINLAKKLFIASNFTTDDEGTPATADEVMDLVQQSTEATFRIVEGISSALGKLTAQNNQN